MIEISRENVAPSHQYENKINLIVTDNYWLLQFFLKLKPRIDTGNLHLPYKTVLLNSKGIKNQKTTDRYNAVLELLQNAVVANGEYNPRETDETPFLNENLDRQSEIGLRANKNKIYCCEYLLNNDSKPSHRLLLKSSPDGLLVLNNKTYEHKILRLGYCLIATPSSDGNTILAITNKSFLIIDNPLI